MKSIIRFLVTKKIILVIPFLFYLAFHLFILNDIRNHRIIPSEPDDTYHSMLKASNMENCLNRDCFGLNDINKQIQYVIDDEDLNYMAKRHAHRVLLSYHPLHSVFIVFLKSFGITQERSYYYFNIIKIVGLALSIFFFTKQLFDINTASIIFLFMNIVLLTSPPSIMEFSYYYFSL